MDDAYIPTRKRLWDGENQFVDFEGLASMTADFFGTTFVLFFFVFFLSLFLENFFFGFTVPQTLIYSFCLTIALGFFFFPFAVRISDPAALVRQTKHFLGLSSIWSWKFPNLILFFDRRWRPCAFHCRGWEGYNSRVCFLIYGRIVFASTISK